MPGVVLMSSKQAPAEACYSEISKRMHGRSRYGPKQQAVIIEAAQATETIRRSLPPLPREYCYLAFLPTGNKRYMWVSCDPDVKTFCSLTSAHYLRTAISAKDACFLLECGKWVLLHEKRT
jgi:hypothetical protein